MPGTKRRPSQEGGPRSALEEIVKVAERLSSHRPALFLDFDGTLARIVPRPEEAQILPGVKRFLRRVAGDWPVAVVSGRTLEDVRMRVGVDDVVYAGEHGLRMEDPDGRVRWAEGVDQAHLDAIREKSEIVTQAIEGVEGAWLERKSCTFAVHTRHVDPRMKDRLHKIVEDVVGRTTGLCWTRGQEVIEVRPDVPWDKGRVVGWLLSVFRKQEERSFVPVVIGDDVGDEAAFQAVRGEGIAIRVAEGEVETAAEFRLSGPDEVEGFLENLRLRLVAGRGVTSR